ncbi:MAG: YceI family protein [Cyanobacteria bacterium RYN_339]|nr:YceI family protein [Cyanobacteria bacterium RYN_339]
MKTLLIATVLLAAAHPVQFAPTSRIWLEGDSTLHRYHSNATQWQVKADSELRSLVVEIPVRGLKSGEGALDDNLYKALKADRYPTIRFASTHCTVKGSLIDAEGTLTVAGATQPTTVHATGDAHHASGTVALKMSSFGVQPPVLLAGAIKCSDQITVHFELVGAP